MKTVKAHTAECKKCNYTKHFLEKKKAKKAKKYHQALKPFHRVKLYSRKGSTSDDKFKRFKYWTYKKNHKFEQNYSLVWKRRLQYFFAAIAIFSLIFYQPYIGGFLGSFLDGVSDSTNKNGVSKDILNNTPNSSISGNNIYEPNENTEDNKKVDVNNPWKKSKIVIAVNNTINPDRNVTKIVSKTLNYWRKNQDKYANYNINFSLKPNSEDPNIIVEFKDFVSCTFDPCVGKVSILNKNAVLTSPK